MSLSRIERQDKVQERYGKARKGTKSTEAYRGFRVGDTQIVMHQLVQLANVASCVLGSSATVRTAAARSLPLSSGDWLTRRPEGRDEWGVLHVRRKADGLVWEVLNKPPSTADWSERFN